jgi:hypothetical protein
MKKEIIILIIILAVLGAAIYINLSGGGKWVGGCAGVHPDHLQECCNRWAKENKIFKPACVGEWEIKNNQCAWQCKSFD